MSWFERVALAAPQASSKIPSHHKSTTLCCCGDRHGQRRGCTSFQDKQPSRSLGDNTRERKAGCAAATLDNTHNAEGACAAVNGFRHAYQVTHRQLCPAQPRPAQPQCNTRQSRAVQELTTPQLRSMGHPNPLKIPLENTLHCSPCNYREGAILVVKKSPQYPILQKGSCVASLMRDATSRPMTLAKGPTHVHFQD